MRAAVLHEVGAALQIEDVSLDEPAAGEVRVRVEAAGLCHTDYHYMKGNLLCQLPVVPGHEGSGVVDAIGAGVSRVAVGDTVCFMWRPWCGECRFCLLGRPALCTRSKILAATGGLLDGTSRLHLGKLEVKHLLGVSSFAEYCVVPERSVVAVPDGVSPEVAAVAGCAVITGVGTVFNVVGACAGVPLLVVGAGGVGLSVVMGAVASGAGPIIVADRNPHALSLATQLGATNVVDMRVGDLVAAVHAICPGGVDWAVEAIGRPETLRQALACLAPGGTAVAVGLASVNESCEVTINDLVQHEKRLVGSLYGSSNPVIELPRLFQLYLAGRLPLDRLVNRCLPLEDVNEGYELLIGGVAGRIVLTPGKMASS